MSDADVRNEATEDQQTLVITDFVTRKKIKEIVDCAQIGSTIRITPPRASDELTSRLHCAIRCIARQLRWAGERLSEEDWKRLLVAALYGQRVLPSPDGKGFVVLDRRTSRMSGKQKYELVEYIYAWGADRGVVFDEESY